MRVRNPSSQLPCTNCTTTVVAKTGGADLGVKPGTGNELKVLARPNPSISNFRLIISSNDLKSPVQLIITDMHGRVMESRTVTVGQTITVGERFISGTYLVSVIQGKETRSLKLIKIPD
jgi:hypothetical protein